MNGMNGILIENVNCFFLRIRILRLAVIFIPAIMGAFAIILLIVGSLATGATRHQIYTGFRSRLGGRIATGFVSIRKKNIHFFDKKKFLFIVRNYCLHYVIDLVHCCDNYGGTMYWFIYIKISLYRNLGIANGIWLARYSLTDSLFNTGNLWNSGTET
jgi:hypothetical protein